MSEKEILNSENEEEITNENKEVKAVSEIDEVLRIFNKRDEKKNEYNDIDAIVKVLEEKENREKAKLVEQQKRIEEINRLTEIEEKKRLSSKPKTMSKGRKFALTLAGLTLVTTLAGVSAKMLKDVHDNQNEQIKVEAFEEGLKTGKTLFEGMKESAEEQDIKEAISDVQHRDNVNKKLNLIKQEIADSNGIDVSNIRIDTNRDEKGNLTIEVIGENGEKINISDSIKNQIVSFIEDYQNPMLDGNVTEQQKQELQEEIDTNAEKNMPVADLPANETEDPER